MKSMYKVVNKPYLQDGFHGGWNRASTVWAQTLRCFVSSIKSTKTLDDEICISTRSKVVADLVNAVHHILEVLEKNNLSVKLFRSVFCANEILYLADFVGRNGVCIDPDKISGTGQFRSLETNFTVSWD